jgi:alginate O-acetyltransferase complex protein AlgJ
MRRAIRIGILLALVAAARAGASEFLQDMGAIADDAAANGASVLRGRDGWLFFAPELRSLSVGAFWGARAATVSRASKPEYADPLPAIVDFHAQLAGAGIELIFVPVPAKAVIYPEAVARTPGGDAPKDRPDARHGEFYDLLRERGVRVLDLTPIFRAHRLKSEGRLYCLQDTHWSGLACEIVAAEIANVIQEAGWVADVPRRPFETAPLSVRITGDLWTALGDTSLDRESLQLKRVAPPTPEPTGWANNEWRESPVLLLGDSHCLVFHAGGDMHARGAGLADHLAASLGFPADVVGVRGSGATPSRLALLRRRDNLAGKRVVVWCLSVREFTEGQGWRKVPVIR